MALVAEKHLVIPIFYQRICKPKEATMMHQEIAEKAKAAQKETNPGAQHKAFTTLRVLSILAT